MKKSAIRNLLLVFFLVSLFTPLESESFELSGMEWAPKRTIWFYHKELPEADRAVEAARQAGKDTECPKEFNEAARMKDEA